MDNKEKYIAKTKGGNTRQLAKTGTKLRLGATKRGIGPAGGAPVSKETGEVFTGRDAVEKIIDKGISINILEEIKIIKERDYFFDKEIASQKNYKRIEYHPLIKKYYFYERSEKKSYLSLTELIVDINKKRELQLKIDKKDINNNLLIINWKIEQNSLPKSLQLNLKKPDWFVLKTLTYSL